MSIKWHKREYRIAKEPGLEARLVGYVSDDNLWGIVQVTAKWPTDDPEVDLLETRWRITHIPTGYAILSGHKYLREAKLICSLLSKRPGLWSFGVFGVYPVWSMRERTIRVNAIKAAAWNAAHEH